jgi:hypothetical protein
MLQERLIGDHPPQGGFDIAVRDIVLESHPNEIVGQKNQFPPPGLAVGAPFRTSSSGLDLDEDAATAGIIAR